MDSICKFFTYLVLPGTILTPTRKRLAELDLQGNNLLHVRRLNALESLKTLNLSMNGLQDLSLDDSMPNLQTLNVSNNLLTRFDVSLSPSLRTLNLDRNAVSRVEGLTSHQHLETLSWRDQNVDSINDDCYQHCHDIRNLYLSSTSLSRLNTDVPFLNLNTLELASMGLQTLPEDFGLKCRNLRTLNINYNAIHDIHPLLGIARLQKLYLAGNRVSRLRRTAAVLDRLSTNLADLDLRNNPLTVGFYTPQNTSAKESRLVLRDPLPSSPSSSHTSTEEDDSATAQAYLLPPLDKHADETSRERLDEDTKLRRRVYEMLLVRSCRALRRLDGLDVERKVVGRRDAVWGRLMELGVLKARGGVGR